MNHPNRTKTFLGQNWSRSKSHLRLRSQTTLSLLGLFALSACTPGTVGDSGGNGTERPPGQASVTLPDGLENADLLPARIRRLTSLEYQRNIEKFIGGDATNLIGTLPPDARQQDFTVNEAQRVDSVLAKIYAKAAASIAAEIVNRIDEFAPCPSADNEACAAQYISTYAAKLYRRSLTDTEKTQHLALYRVGVEDGGYPSGISLVTEGMLQSPSFIYHTEIGESYEGNTQLTGEEIANLLSHLLESAPPDAELLAKASTLKDPEVRIAEAQRILGKPEAADRVVQFIREWLEIDSVADTAKDSIVYPEYNDIKASIDKESLDFIREVLVSSSSISDLFGADYSVIDDKLATFYGASGAGKVTLSRRGILNQAAFLATHAHAHESAPIMRGVAIMHRVACIDVASPTTLNIAVVPPIPDPTKTTRERFAIHSTDPECAACHNSIDAFGFAFEQYDGMGGYRTTENTSPVDSAVQLNVGAPYDGAYANSDALAVALSQSTEVNSCFSTHLFRGLMGTSSENKAESHFLEQWQQLSAPDQSSIFKALLELIKDPAFTLRRVAP